MLSCEVTRGAIYMHDDCSPKFEVSGVIGLSGLAAGTVVLSLSKDVALKAASTMLMVESTEIDGDVTDAVGELTNMVAGAAEAQIEDIKLSIGLPNVVVGKDFEIRFPSNVRPIVIPYDSPWGPFALQVGFAPIPEPALV
ncbi:MAG: chemotaxis protein CheX [Pirellulales bacterium]